MENKTTRRASFKKLGMGLAAMFGIGAAARAMDGGSKPKKEVVVLQCQEIYEVLD